MPEHLGRVLILDELVTSKNNIQVLTYLEDRGKYPGHYLKSSRKLSRTFLNLAGDLSQWVNTPKDSLAMPS